MIINFTGKKYSLTRIALIFEWVFAVVFLNEEKNNSAQEGILLADMF